MPDKYILIRYPTAVEESLKLAAHKRKIPKVHLIERLLTVIATDKLIDAVLDDFGSGEWNKNEERSRSAI